MASAVVSVKDLPVQARSMMQAMAAVELCLAQRLVANYFEVAYLKLEDMQDVARQVRETANNARTQHLMTNGLMKKFTLTASLIVNTMIPQILDAVELGDKDIIVLCFALILGMAQEMKKEAEETQQRYHLIQAQLQGNMATIVEKNKQNFDEEKTRAIEIDTEKGLLKAEELKVKQLEEEKKKMDTELENLKQYRDQMMEESVNVVVDDKSSSFLDAAIAPGTALGKGIEAVVGVVNAGVNIFKSIFGGKEETPKAKSVQETFKDSQATVERMLDKNQDMIDRMHDQRVNALERLAKIRKLAMAEVSIGNAESLREASGHLGDIDMQFTRLIQFWSNMAAVLEFLKNDTEAGKVYLSKIEKPQYANRFKASISRSEQGWTHFGRICGDYIVDSKSNIDELYAFLSSPIEIMSADERKKRIQGVMQKIEDDINNALPEQKPN